MFITRTRNREVRNLQYPKPFVSFVNFVVRPGFSWSSRSIIANVVRSLSRLRKQPYSDLRDAFVNHFVVNIPSR